MQITVNDAPREINSGATVSDLLGELKLNVAHVAVERNRELIPRRNHATTMLTAGDRVEVVTLVGGG